MVLLSLRLLICPSDQIECAYSLPSLQKGMSLLVVRIEIKPEIVVFHGQYQTYLHELYHVSSSNIRHEKKNLHKYLQDKKCIFPIPP